MKTAAEWIRETSPYELVEVDKINWGDDDYELTADWRQPEIANFIREIQRDAIKAAAAKARFGCSATLSTQNCDCEQECKRILKLLPPED